MGNGKYFDIKSLLPFHKQGKGVPRSIRGEEEKIAELDPDLNPEELSYIRHYLGYADIMLNAPPDDLAAASTKEEPREEKVIAMPGQAKPKQFESPVEDPSQAQNKKQSEDGDTEAA